jgi:hypothetical protein
LCGNLGKKSPSAFLLGFSQARWIVVRNGSVYWWGSKEDEDSGVPWKGQIDFSVNPCEIANKDGSETAFYVAPEGKNWVSGAFTGADAGRVFDFDACSSEYSRDQWVASMREHAAFARAWKGGANQNSWGEAGYSIVRGRCATSDQPIVAATDQTTSRQTTLLVPEPRPSTAARRSLVAATSSRQSTVGRQSLVHDLVGNEQEEELAEELEYERVLSRMANRRSCRPSGVAGVEMPDSTAAASSTSIIDTGADSVAAPPELIQRESLVRSRPEAPPPPDVSTFAKAKAPEEEEMQRRITARMSTRMSTYRG